MTLSETQSKFLELVYSPKFDALAEAWAEQHLKRGPVTTKSGFKIYRKNLVFGLCGALQKTFPFCCYLLGETNFTFLCRDYIYENPSRSSDVIDYGANFPDFLVVRGEIRDLPFLPDIARLEWAAERAFYSPGFESLIQTRYEISRSYLAFVEEGTEAVEENPFRKGVERIVVSAKEGLPHITWVDGGCSNET